VEIQILKKGKKNPYYFDEKKDNQKITPPSPSLQSPSPTPIHKGTSVPLSDGQIPYQKILEKYHTILPELSKIEKLTDGLKKKIKSRWVSDKDRQAVEWWEWYFSGIRDCDFLMGFKTDWAATFHWLIGPENMEKVLSGNYLNKGTGSKLGDTNLRAVRRFVENE